MILDLLDLKRRGKEQENFYFEYFPQDQISTGIPEVEIRLPVEIQGEITLIGDKSALIDAEVRFILKGECTRCLTQTEREYFATISEEVDSESEPYRLVNDKVDLKKIVEDALIMNMPVKFLCKEDCKGICTGCGVNLNEAKCKCNNKEGE